MNPNREYGDGMTDDNVFSNHSDRKKATLIRADSHRLAYAVQFLLERGSTDRLRQLLKRLHPADVADVLENLDDDSMHEVFSLIDRESAPDVLEEVEDRDQAALAEGLSDGFLASLVEDMYTDEAVDLIQLLSPQRASRILSLVAPDDQADLKRLLRFPPQTAGAIMDAEFASVVENSLVAEAIEAVRSISDELEDIHYVYVVDSRNRLKGVLPLHRLLLTPPGAPISGIMISDVITVPPEMDQEEVALISQRYDLERIPVVDDSGTLLGRITVTDIVDVVSDEAGEDLSRIAGVDDEEIRERSVFRISRLRLPWLVVGLGGGIASALLISRYQASLEELIVLAFFVPVITNMGGNVGIQSSAIAIRGLATGEIRTSQLVPRLWTELRVGILNGIATGLLLAILSGLWQGPRVALILGISMISVHLVATCTGSLIPMILKRLGQDPALAAGPFITTMNDVLDLFVYLGIASSFLAYWNT